jgi:hypothetical protein
MLPSPIRPAIEKLPEPIHVALDRAQNVTMELEPVAHSG